MSNEEIELFIKKHTELEINKPQQITYETIYMFLQIFRKEVKGNCNLADVSGSALTKLDSKLLLPLIEKRRLEIEDYTIEFHELGHLIEKIKHNAG